MVSPAFVRGKTEQAALVSATTDRLVDACKPDTFPDASGKGAEPPRVEPHKTVCNTARSLV
jgi:hypothetical protein